MAALVVHRPYATARLVIKQFLKMEEVQRQLEAMATAERSLRERLAGELREAERRERELAVARGAADAANRAKSIFLANMSHELRTPLNAIIGYSELIVEEITDLGAEHIAPDLQKINAAGKHLLTLINEVLDLSKIEAGRLVLCEESFDVAEAISEVVATVRPLAEKNGNRLEVSCAANLGTIYSDLVRVRQCLFNLLSNACKFTHQGTVSLRVHRVADDPQHQLAIQVADTGIGMTAGELDKLYEPFVQGGPSVARKYGGTGLGLAITRAFVEKLGGEIQVESAKGRGSTFTIRLPARVQGATVDALPVVQPTAISLPEDAPAVLAIDDDPDTLEWIARSLGAWGVRVITASSGRRGIELAKEDPPAVIILDVVMPRMDGWAVLSELKADPALAAIPVIVVSVLEDRHLGLALGVSDYLTKPVDRERLIGAVQRCCRGDRGPVLVVEDDRPTRQAVRRTLEREGWVVVEAENGRDGIERLANLLPGLILLDLMMPEMDGFEFVERLRQHELWRFIPVVVVTAKDLSDGERARLHDHVQRIVMKGDYSREDLLAEIRRLVVQHVALPREGVHA